MNNNLEIRPLMDKDFTDWKELFGQYTAFYETDFSTIPVQITWERLLSPSSTLHGFGALLNGGLVGIVHYVTHLSSWSVEPYFYLEDLFTSKQARQNGIGEKLIDAVRYEAMKAGSHRIYWVTKQSNKVAQSLYDKKAEKTDFIQYRITL